MLRRRLGVVCAERGYREASRRQRRVGSKCGGRSRTGSLGPANGAVRGHVRPAGEPVRDRLERIWKRLRWPQQLPAARAELTGISQSAREKANASGVAAEGWTRSKRLRRQSEEMICEMRMKWFERAWEIRLGILMNTRLETHRCTTLRRVFNLDVRSSKAHTRGRTRSRMARHAPDATSVSDGHT